MNFSEIIIAALPEALGGLIAAAIIGAVGWLVTKGRPHWRRIFWIAFAVIVIVSTLLGVYRLGQQSITVKTTPEGSTAIEVTKLVEVSVTSPPSTASAIAERLTEVEEDTIQTAVAVVL